MFRSIRFVFAMLVLGIAAQANLATASAAPRVVILMYNSMEIIDFAGPYEVFGHAGFDVYTVSADGRPVTTAMNLSVNVDGDFASAPKADILLIPGGNVRAAAQDPAIRRFIEAQSATADHVLSVCTGSFILASTGLLDGKQATTFHGSFDAMAKQFPAVQILRDRRWVDAGKIVTSAGLASGIDAALHVVAQVRGVGAARTVAMMLEHPWSPSPRDGFIRGLMADQHLRLPARMDFPHGTAWRRRESFGDKRRWKMVYEVSSPLSPAAFVAQLRTLAVQDHSLRVVNGRQADRVAWTYVDGAGQWKLSVAVDEMNGDGTFRLVAVLAAQS